MVESPRGTFHRSLRQRLFVGGGATSPRAANTCCSARKGSARLREERERSYLAYSILFDRENASGPVAFGRRPVVELNSSVSFLYRLCQPLQKSSSLFRFYLSLSLSLSLSFSPSPSFCFSLSSPRLPRFFVPPTQPSRLVRQPLAISTSRGGACNFPGDAPSAIVPMVAFVHGRGPVTSAAHHTLVARPKRSHSRPTSPVFGARESSWQPGEQRRATSRTRVHDDIVPVR